MWCCLYVAACRHHLTLIYCHVLDLISHSSRFISWKAKTERLCNKWVMRAYGRSSKEMVTCTVCASHLIGCSVYPSLEESVLVWTRLLKQSQGLRRLNRDFCLFIRNEFWSLLFPTCSLFRCNESMFFFHTELDISGVRQKWRAEC